jgi:hypothetical protein
MNKNKKSYNNSRERNLLFKRSHFVLFMCIVLTAVLAITMINNQFATAGNSLQMSNNDIPNYPIHQRNYTENLNCDYEGCHDQLPQPWINVVEIENTTSTVKYSVEGQTDLYNWTEGWAVLDEFDNNIDGGLGPSEFIIQKEETEKNYTVYWVDSDTELFGKGGSNYIKITVPISEDTPPTPPVITGLANGYTDNSYNYKFVSTDNEGHKIRYRVIDWGDGNSEDWSEEEYDSGQGPTYPHIWSDPGIYTITAQARANGLLSEESTFEVNITVQPFEPSLKIRLKMASIGQIRVTFENKGQGDLSGIDYTVTAKGGLFRIIKRIDFSANGTIDNLTSGEKTLVSIPHESLRLRACAAKVTITAEAGGKTFIHNQLVVVLGRFVFARPILLLQP